MAVVASVAIGGSIAGLEISGSPGASSSSPEAVGGARPASVEIYAESGAGFRKAQTVLLAGGFEVHLTVRFGGDCAGHSYGQVRKFFQADPCKWLARAYLSVNQGSQGLALVAISWVDMRSNRLAGKFKRLVDASGTGNVTELSRDVGPYRNVKYSGNFYVSGRDGAAVWNAQVQPLGPTPTATVNLILKDSRQ